MQEDERRERPVADRQRGLRRWVSRQFGSPGKLIVKVGGLFVLVHFGLFALKVLIGLLIVYLGWNLGF